MNVGIMDKGIVQLVIINRLVGPGGDGLELLIRLSPSGSLASSLRRITVT